MTERDEEPRGGSPSETGDDVGSPAAGAVPEAARAAEDMIDEDRPQPGLGPDVRAGEEATAAGGPGGAAEEPTEATDRSAGPWSAARRIPIAGDADARREIRDAAPGLARLTVGSWARTAGWAVSSYARAGAWALRAAAGREDPAALVGTVREVLREQVSELLGDGDLGRLGRAVGRGALGADDEDRSRGEILLDRGARLLDESSEVGEPGGAHPAYERILEVLDPDEARVLVLFAIEGPQAAVDVRTWRPFDLGSSLVLQGASMVASEAGCRDPDRIPQYFNNLHRLGLVWFSREPLDDLVRYQVLEAQPEVTEAARRAGRARIVRRSICLTPFGVDFCRTCLPLPPGVEIVDESTPAMFGPDPPGASE